MKKISEQIKWVGIGWFTYGLLMLMPMFKTTPPGQMSLAFPNMLFGAGVFLRINPIIQIGRIYLWLSLIMMSALVFGLGADHGINPTLSARAFIIPDIGVVFLLWFFRRICVARELDRDRKLSVEQPVEGIKEQLAIKNPVVWWILIAVFSSAVWGCLL